MSKWCQYILSGSHPRFPLSRPVTNDNVESLRLTESQKTGAKGFMHILKIWYTPSLFPPQITMCFPYNTVNCPHSTHKDPRGQAMGCFFVISKSDLGFNDIIAIAAYNIILCDLCYDGSMWCIESIYNRSLTHWGQDKMAAVFLTTFSNAFSSCKCINFD